MTFSPHLPSPLYFPRTKPTPSIDKPSPFQTPNSSRRQVVVSISDNPAIAVFISHFFSTSLSSPSQILPLSLVLHISFLLGVFFFSISGKARTRSMTRSQNHDDEEASSSSNGPKFCAPWSDLDHNLLFLVMMRLGFVEFFSFRGVCKSWRSLACENQNKFMASMPPMQMCISCGTFEKTCHLEDFEGRKLKTILPNFVGGECVGVTCGYLIFFEKSTCDYWLVNPITRKLLHFPHFPFDYPHGRFTGRDILVFSPSISGLVFVVFYMNEIWFSVVGKGTWNCVPHSFKIIDLCVFKGKIYILTYGSDTPYHLCELRLNPQPKLTLLKIKRPHSFVKRLASSAENLYVIDRHSECLITFFELDLGEMKWVVPCEKTMEEYAFFRSKWNHIVAVKRESWADPQSWSHTRFALSEEDGENTFWTKKMWYFPHQCMSVDSIDD